MNNPFETGHIKNYLLLYASVVVIMVLFFIAGTLFRDTEVFEKKSFPAVCAKNPHAKKTMQNNKEKQTTFKLLN